jgi:hypothetical protein
VKRRWILWLIGLVGAVVFLVNLACGPSSFAPQPPTAISTPSSPLVYTSVLEPTPPSASEGQMVSYTNTLAGFSVPYPEGWVYGDSTYSVYFAETQEGLESRNPALSPLFIVRAGMPEDMELVFEAAATTQELLDSLLTGSCGEECEIGESEPWVFGETPGLGVEASWLDPWAGVRVRGYLVAAVSDEVAGVGVTVSPETLWDSYEPIFQSMLTGLEFFPPVIPEPVERGAIQPGEVMGGVLPPGGTDIWSFDALEGQYVTVWLDAVDVDVLDTYLELHDEGGLLVAEDDDGGEQTNSAIVDFAVTISGTYYIHAMPLQGEGDYMLRLELAEEPSGGGEIGYGEVVEGMLAGGGEHAWTFDGEAEDVVTIAMGVVDGALDCYLGLYDPDDVLLTYDDDSGVKTDALIEYYTLPEQGSYRIAASNVSDEPGSYGLTLALTELLTEGHLTYGETVTATLESGTRHHWLFEGEEGDVVTISMTAVDENLDTYLELFAPDGVRVMIGDDSSESSDAEIREFELPLSGTYRIIARGFEDEDAGRYVLTLTGP